jgi:hypothetical protein
MGQLNYFTYLQNCQYTAFIIAYIEDHTTLQWMTNVFVLYAANAAITTTQELCKKQVKSIPDCSNIE